MNGDEVCTCGDVADEHGADYPHPCEVDECECSAFKEDEEATEKAREAEGED